MKRWIPRNLAPLPVLAALLCSPGLAWGQAPGDITGLSFPDAQTLSWDDEPLADTFNVYRGKVSDLTAGRNGLCHAPGLTGTTLAADAVPTPGDPLFYLVTGEAAGAGEGPAGVVRLGGVDSPRQLLAACSVALPAHVTARLGFGLDEYAESRIAAVGMDGYVSEQLDPAAISEADNTDLNDRLAVYADPQDLFDLLGGHIVRSVYSRRQLEQRMAMFWANHFNTYFGKVADSFAEEWFPFCSLEPQDFCDVAFPALSYREAARAMHREVEAFRDLAFNGSFRQMLEASAKSPAMIYYLDSYLSEVLSPNENYAREIMELHSMGVDGGYDQTDVEELTRALTGWGVCKKLTADVDDPLAPCIDEFWWLADPEGQWTAHFDPTRHDCTSKTIFAGTPQETVFPDTCGTPSDGLNNMQIALDAVAGHPSTAPFVSRKILELLVTDSPDQAMVDALVAVWNDPGNPHGIGDLREVTRAALELAAFRDLATTGAKIKTPFEHFMSALRNLRGTTNGQASLVSQSFPGKEGYIFRARHVPFYNLVPTGWPEAGSEWIDSNTILERQNFGMHVALVNGVNFGTDLISLLNDHGIATTPGNAEAIVDFLSVRMFGSLLPPADRQRTLDFLLTADDGSPDPDYTESRIRQTAGVMLGYAQFMAQ